MGLFFMVMDMIEDFIGVFPNAFTEDFCKRVIDHFDFVRQNTTYVRPRTVEGSDPLDKDDHSMYLSNIDEIKQLGFIHRDFSNEFFDVSGRCLHQYYSKYSILNRVNTDHGPRSGVFDLKIQKTDPGEGYHQWHCESFDRHSMFRYLAYTVYLNTVDEGGETEFLYQKQRLKPEVGTIVIWPAGWTHVHRGNPPLSGSKYIITTWEEFV